MTKPSRKHTSAIMQSIKLLENAFNNAAEPKFKRALLRDIRLHEEVRSMLFHMIENPTLPFLDDRQGHEEPILNQIEDDPNGAF